MIALSDDADAEPAGPSERCLPPKPPTSDAERAHVLARCVVLLRRRGAKEHQIAAVRRVLASLRPDQPEPTAEESTPAPAGRQRRFKGAKMPSLMPIRPKAERRIDTSKVRR